MHVGNEMAYSELWIEKSTTRTHSFRAAILVPSGWDIPEGLKGLRLFESDRSLCERWEELKLRWEPLYPGMDFRDQAVRAHTKLEVLNRDLDRSKIRYLHSWMENEWRVTGGSSGRSPPGGPSPWRTEKEAADEFVMRGVAHLAKKKMEDEGNDGRPY